MKFRLFNIATIIIAGSITLLAFYNIISFWWLIPAVLIYLTITALGSAILQWQMFIPAACSIKNPQQLLLTFDDGPHPHTNQILDTLSHHDCKAIFFCVGKQAIEYPEIVRRIIDEGHIVGNHTQNHLVKWGWLSESEVANEIRQAQYTLQKVCGNKPAYFRPPFGVSNPNIAKALRKFELQTIGWNIRSLDTVIKNPDRLWRRVKSRLRGGSILLLHDNRRQSADLLEKTIAHCRSSGINIANPHHIEFDT